MRETAEAGKKDREMQEATDVEMAISLVQAFEAKEIAAKVD